ncbi:PLP-dependent transferase [Hygrophoropsis aurantiaca]|uniref:PLP-dependent transferase n=1 Tax=Hygrophoropsis aurantiaca TaxID=72124 RepID=A0ACB7ZRV4_9AGAM|nr:PLP-dependent transferase [Hygrophoropsis aurantiaca]
MTTTTTSQQLQLIGARVAQLTQSRGFQYGQSALAGYVVWTYVIRVYYELRARGIRGSARALWTWSARHVLLLVLRLPRLQRRVTSEMDDARKSIRASLLPQSTETTPPLPLHGLSPAEIHAAMDALDVSMGADATWTSGKISGAVYHGGPALSDLLASVYARYLLANPLHPELFPAVRAMEAQVVAACLALYNAPPNAAGTTTSGGTESIFLAVKTHREWARAERGIAKGWEIVVPESAHAAFEKAAEWLCIRVRKVPVHPVTRKAVLARVSRAITPNTIMLVASAPNFPDGNQDDIPALAALARKHRIGLHVDACLGGFILPFLEETGLAAGSPAPDGRTRYALAPFDFRVDGVTSVSCDTHKYGFAPKGSSVIMYRSAALRRYQYYISPDWSGGVYASPSISGSRPGALIATTWAALHHLGRAGYLDACRAIVGAARKIAEGRRMRALGLDDGIPELYVLGNPVASVVAFGARVSDGSSVDPLGDAMGRRGWHLNALADPPAVHIACTVRVWVFVWCWVAFVGF